MFRREKACVSYKCTHAFFGIGQGPAGYTILEQEGKVYQNYGWMDHSPAVRGAYECAGSV